MSGISISISIWIVALRVAIITAVIAIANVCVIRWLLFPTYGATWLGVQNCRLVLIQAVCTLPYRANCEWGYAAGMLRRPRGENRGTNVSTKRVQNTETLSDDIPNR